MPRADPIHREAGGLGQADAAVELEDDEESDDVLVEVEVEADAGVDAGALSAALPEVDVPRLSLR